MVRPLRRAFILVLSSATVGFGADLAPSRSSAATRLTITLAGDCAASEKVLSLARSETARIWSRADVAIRWVDATEVPYDAPLSQWLVVRCAADGTAVDAEAPNVLPIAGIRFVNALPTNTIVLSVDNANTLLARAILEFGDPRGWVVPFREIRLGRLLGRAIAHEVGHFLTQSRSHTRSGLMRATHTVGALTGASLGPFAVDDDLMPAARLSRAAGERPAPPRARIETPVLQDGTHPPR